MKSANLAMSDHLFRAAWRSTGRYRGLEVFVLPTLAIAIAPAPPAQAAACERARHARKADAEF